MLKFILVSMLFACCFAACPSDIGTACGVLFEHVPCDGDKLIVNEGASVASMPSGWNDIISSIVVNAGCEMTVFQHANFEGAVLTVTAETLENLKKHPLGGGTWNDVISSYECICAVCHA